jgi:hypothetical protein
MALHSAQAGGVVSLMIPVWSHWRRRGAGEEGLGQSNQLIQRSPVLRLLKRTPQLQRKQEFENNVSWLSREFSLYGKLITGSPESPALGSEKDPYQSFRPLPQRVQDTKPLHS